MKLLKEITLHSLLDIFLIFDLSINEYISFKFQGEIVYGLLTSSIDKT